MALDLVKLTLNLIECTHGLNSQYKLEVGITGKIKVSLLAICHCKYDLDTFKANTSLKFCNCSKTGSLGQCLLVKPCFAVHVAFKQY